MRFLKKIIYNPFFRRDMGLYGMQGRMFWRNPFFRLIIMCVFLMSGPVVIYSFLNQWLRSYEGVIFVPIALIALVSLYAVIVPFVQTRRLITSQSIEHLVISPLGWEGIISGKVAAHTVRSLALTISALVGLAFVLILIKSNVRYFSSEYAYLTVSLIVPLPCFAYFMIVMSIHYSIRFFHTWVFALLWQIIYGAVIMFGTILFFAIFAISSYDVLNSTWNVLGFSDDAIIITSFSPLAAVMYWGWGRFYRIKMREFLRGNVLERLLSGKTKIRAFGSLPWYRVDLFRQLWPLKTWARLRFIANCYVLVFLIVTLPISLQKNLPSTVTTIMFLIWWLPYVLCYFSLPGHWRSVMEQVPQAWQSEIPDQDKALPPWVLLRVLVVPWLFIYTIISFFWGCLYYSFFLYTSYLGSYGFFSSYSIRRRPLWERFLNSFFETPLNYVGFFAGIFLGWMFVLLYMRHVAQKEEKGGSAYLPGWHLLLVVMYIGISCFLTLLRNKSFSYALWGPVYQRYYHVFENNGYMMSICLVVIVFYPLRPYLTNQVLNILRRLGRKE